MSLKRAGLSFVAIAVVAGSFLMLRAANADAQGRRPLESVAVFSACGQAPDAARTVQGRVNAWFDDNRNVRVLQREMFTAACPGVNEYGSIAITIAIHYQ